MVVRSPQYVAEIVKFWPCRASRGRVHAVEG